MKLSLWTPEEIVVENRLRKRLREDVVLSLMESIRRIGLCEPPTIRVEPTEEGSERGILVAGLHRVEACKRLGLIAINCFEFKGGAVETRLWEIAENLHRAELTVQERAEHIAEWVRLTETGSGQAVQPYIRSDGRALNLGIAKAARELPIAGPTEHARRKTVERAVKIDSMKPEAKEAAKSAAINNNQSALLRVANEGTTEKQLAAIQRERERLEETKRRRSADTSDEAKMFADWLIQRMSPGDLPTIVSWLEECNHKHVIAAMRKMAA
jgi:ParB-like chromosome segregation protein Spo0J